MIPGYHKLSLDIIRSMTAERPKTTAAAIGRLPKTGRRAAVSPAAAADVGTRPALPSTTTLPVITAGSPLRKGVSFAADSRRKQTVLAATAPGQAQQQQQHQQQAATSKKGWLLSEASLSHAVIQHLDFNLQHQAKQHLFLEVS